MMRANICLALMSLVFVGLVDVTSAALIWNNTLLQELDLNLKNVYENLLKDTPLGTLQCDETQSSIRIRYKVQEGDNYVAVNAISGRVTLRKSVDYEHEQSNNNGQRQIKFECTSVLTNGSTSVPIIHETEMYVLDINDNAPFFNKTNNNQKYYVKISELTRIGDEIYDKINVTDRDGPGGNSEVDAECYIDPLGTPQDREDQRLACETFSVRSVLYGTTRGIYKFIVSTLDNVTANVQYTMTIRATDRGNPVLSSFDTVNILIDDIQNSPPEFRNTPYAFSLVENAPPGRELTKELISSEPTALGAFDGDIGDPNSITFFLRASEQSSYAISEGFFELGEIFTFGEAPKVYYVPLKVARNKTIDREILEENPLTLRLVAQELGDASRNPMNATADIVITIRDDNDVKPTFNKNFYTLEQFELLSPQNPYQLDLNIVVDDTDSKNANIYKLEIISGNESGIFRLNINEGEGENEVLITVNDETFLDYEVPENRNTTLVLKATDLNKPEFSSTAVVNIQLMDLNDNSPVFERSSVVVVIKESVEPPLLLTTVNATDADSGENAAITYSLSVDNTTFHIDELTGDLFLIAEVNYEDIPLYSFAVIATDNGTRPSHRISSVGVNVIVLNVEDVGPVFSPESYFASLREMETVFSIPIQLQATVPNEPETVIRYSIESVTPPALLSKFNLDRSSGRLDVIQEIDSRETDPDKPNVIVLSVSACTVPASIDTVVLCADSAVVIDLIDLNNFPPVFDSKSYVAYVNETAKPRQYVLTLNVTDADGPGQHGTVTFRIRAGAGDSFVVNDQGDIFVSDNPNIDFNEDSEYNLEVVARDNGTPSKATSAIVTIYILDTNNKKPEFDSPLFFFTVYDNEGLGYIVGDVTATDLDSNSSLQYSIDFATAGYEVNTFPGKDPAIIQEARNAFDINPANGSIFVNGALDRTKYSRITFTVVVEDLNQVFIPGQPQTATTKVYVTVLSSEDQSPYFSAPWSRTNPVIELTRKESSNIDWILYSLYATDPVTQTAITRFEEDPDTDVQNYFSIVNSSVIVKRGLDYESLTSKTLNYKVWAISQAGNRSEAILVIKITDANDNIPIFSEIVYEFTIDEGLAFPNKVGEIFASDGDEGSYAQIEFSLVSSDSDAFFLYDNRNNQADLYVQRGAVLDYENKTEYSLTVRARDNPGRSSNEQNEVSVQVIVRLNDTNDNSPIFEKDPYSFRVLGSALKATFVDYVLATDLDQGRNGEITYSLHDSTSEAARVFEVTTELRGDVRVGAIYTSQALSSLPDKQVFNLVVRATDRGTPITRFNITNALITVASGASDPNPKWDDLTKNRTTISISENVDINYLVLTAKAYPQYANSSIIYSFLKDSLARDYESFSIGSISGEIRTAALFDRETKSSYDLQLLATDASDDSLTTQLLLTINITDVDDNFPSFKACPDAAPLPVPVFASVLEELPPFQLVYTARACDIDLIPFNKVSYRLFSDDTYCNPEIDSYFMVEQDTGEVLTKMTLDRETRDEFLVCVQAYPGENKRRKRRDLVDDVSRDRVNDTDIAYILVRVLDSNDRPPKYPIGDVIKVILEYPDVEVMVSEALDDDLPPYNDIRYSIESIYFTVKGKSHLSPTAFRINSGNGAISIGTNDYRDYIGGYFTLTVKAEDKYQSNLSDTQTIKVFIAAERQQVRVVFNKATDTKLIEDVNSMINELNGLNEGVVYEVKKISYHIVSNDADPLYDRTDVCMVIIRDNDVISSVSAIRGLTDNNDVETVLDKYGARDPGPCEPARSVYPTGWEAYWWVLVAFAIFIFLVTVILIVLVIILYDHLKNYMKSKRTYLVPGSD